MLDEKQPNQEQDNRNNDPIMIHIGELIDIAQSNDLINIVSILEVIDIENNTTIHRTFGNGSISQTIGLIDIGKMLANDLVYGDVEDDIG